MFSSILFSLTVLLPALVRAVTPDFEPCHHGECSWDLSSDAGSVVFHATGSYSSISDLTEASGWVVLDCDTNAKDQDIRVACGDPERYCDHVFENGVENTLVRLPQGCGSTPFAVAVRGWDHENQTVPESMRSKLAPRDGSMPVVKGISLSANLSSIDISQHGDITFFVQASSIAGIAHQLHHSPSSTRSLSKRMWSRRAIARLDELHAAPDLASERVSLKRGFASINSTNSSSGQFSYTSPGVSIFNTSLSCPQEAFVPAFDGEVNVALTGSVSGDFNYGYVLVASPSTLLSGHTILSFSLVADSTISATMAIDSSLSASWTAEATVFTFPIEPALGVPDLIVVGPIFEVDVQADAEIDAEIHMSVDFAYNVKNAHFVLGDAVSSVSDSGDGNGTFAPADTNLRLAAGAAPSVSLTLSAHLIPSIDFGIVIGSGLETTKATVGIALDASVSMGMNLTTTTDTTLDASGLQPVTTTSYGGCFSVDAGLSVPLTAEADLIELLEADHSLSLFEKNWTLYERCFGNSSNSAAEKRSILNPLRDVMGERERTVVAAKTPSQNTISGSSIAQHVLGV
ncbi:uncharacterized protein BXZ73DRAFT_104667 [Epithele typhae]|uniref:uncharacterized protein n=1 Tax=Epithele typhae TaxID=378194 RepID=UPI002008A59C|nr:uncharacterized protein BXZ73DRAFT_104667 [Epithele typhae]KAH9920541.1 hypothetical protein BXZ73DRAFT_104667 [Epithele typhae]